MVEWNTAAREPGHTLGGGWSRRYDTHHASVSCAAAVGAGHHAGRRGGGGCRGAGALWPGPSSGTSQKAWGRTGRTGKETEQQEERKESWREMQAAGAAPTLAGRWVPAAVLGLAVTCSCRSHVFELQEPEDSTLASAVTGWWRRQRQPILRWCSS
ncbi:hypothetical protein PLESTB_000939000 [Pleodorina starrii]|uniref:Uncharacterized protein n=1 Tax=Pleodorina starrii TaxID=330485 RepID=A0A9W6F3C8_9CHLO|nr:hypothetical protein PLESTM_000706900 [Pleodorina starrii]GLC55048.1 hypothetical protein PLESTB_000938100 [Pleodorina starrii]GLC55056.1 hypothetical protein PLESTB_000939000 [Pleodorina starrii]